MSRASSHAVAAISQTGVLEPIKAAPFADRIGLPPVAKQEKRAMFASARHNRVAAAEVDTWPLTAQEARAAGQYDHDWPVAVITAQNGDGAAWKPQHQAPALASKYGFFEEVEGSNHASLLGPKYADHIVRGVTFVMDAAAGRIAPAVRTTAAAMVAQSLAAGAVPSGKLLP
jgi:hypothetical protein